jgi:leader peptidase (prepilin peptidase)/N-methyltransferase
MSSLNYFLTFILGLFTGSFLNVVADRSVSDESIVFGRSHCDKCKKNLGPKDLIPLLSFILSGGKCRHCGVKLSLWYPVSEFLTGVVFSGVLYLSMGFNLDFVYLVVIASFYIILFLTDAKYRLIPNKIVWPAIVFTFLFNLSQLIYTLITYYRNINANEFGKYLIKSGFFQSQVLFMLKTYGIDILSALGIAFFFWFLVFITKGRGMGGGDITLGLLIGLFNKFPNNVLAIFLGFLFGTIFVLPLVIFKIKKLKDTVPFGPFLILGSIVAYIFGSYLLNWYLNLLRY